MKRRYAVRDCLTRRHYSVTVPSVVLDGCWVAHFKVLVSWRLVRKSRLDGAFFSIPWLGDLTCVLLKITPLCCTVQ